ncbi:MAG TPA: vitamin K epoxide reductase family protein, partial [Chloroflexota bacterium]|nr:vitamin K epoxide reductase family protein [Chloroflexota bacterium]
RAILALVGMTAFGVLFSIYLTYLEPFVIGAVCAWCLTSAVVMTLLLVMSVETAVSHLSPEPT